MKCCVKIFDGDIFAEELDYDEVYGDDVISVLQERWDKFPETARIYLREVSQATDVTPNSEIDIEHLKGLTEESAHLKEETFIVIVYPAGPIGLLGWLMIAMIAVTVVAAFVLKPKIPNVSARNVQSSSPNNQLSNRTNQARPKARIPDIYGTIRAYPDIIQETFKFFSDGKELETSLLCLGRGYFEFHKVQESDTNVSQIIGSAVSIWDPNLDLLSDPPTYTYGRGAQPAEHIWDTYGVAIIRRSNSVDGQTLVPSDGANFFTALSTFYSDGRIEVQPLSSDGSQLDQRFNVGENVTVNNALFGRYSRSCVAKIVTPDGFELEMLQSLGEPDPVVGDDFRIEPARFAGINLAGTYKVASVSRVNQFITITFVNPATVNPNWNALPSDYNPISATATWGDFTNTFSLNGTYEVLETSSNWIRVETSPEWASLPLTGLQKNVTVSAEDSESAAAGGPFRITEQDIRCIVVNFYAGQGLYKDDGRNQTAMSVQVQIRVQPLDENGDPSGAAIIRVATVTGSASSRDAIGYTEYIDVTAADSYDVSCFRTTPSDTEFNGSVVDELKWRDLYSASVTSVASFGNVTIIRATTRATQTALALKERKLNCTVTRKIPMRIAGDQFTEELYPTNRLDDIFSEICRDPYIGNRPSYEIDYSQIYAKTEEARLYFGFDQSVEYCYTIDAKDITFEEIAQMVAGAGLLTAYRQGSIIRFEFEREGAVPKLLFNHRNKAPGSESRTYQFARDNNYDGIEYSYVNPRDDSISTLYIPNNSSLNPKRIESVGVRNANQAHIHAWREWNKLTYLNTVVEIDALAEAETVIPPQCVMISDNTNSSTADGQIRAVNGLTVELSQPVMLEADKSYSIYLQLTDGSIDNIPIVGGTDVWITSVTLQRPPTKPLIPDENYVSPTVYEILAEDDTGVRKYIITEREGGGADNIYPLVAINYDDRYYANDRDYAPSEEEEWLKSLGDMVLRLDARAIETIFEQDGRILRWADRSDYTNDATQNTASFRPDLNTDFLPRSVGFDDNVN